MNREPPWRPLKLVQADHDDERWSETALVSAGVIAAHDGHLITAWLIQRLYRKRLKRLTSRGGNP